MKANALAIVSDVAKLNTIPAGALTKIDAQALAKLNDGFLAHGVTKGGTAVTQRLSKAQFVKLHASEFPTKSAARREWYNRANTFKAVHRAAYNLDLDTSYLPAAIRSTVGGKRHYVIDQPKAEAAVAPKAAKIVALEDENAELKAQVATLNQQLAAILENEKLAALLAKLS